MKLAILIDRLNVGGVEKVAIEEVRALISLGVNAKLYVLRRKPVVENAFSDLIGTIPIEYLDDRFPQFLKFNVKIPVFHFFSLFHLTYPLLLPFYIKNNEFDHLVAHGTYTTFSAITLKIARGIQFSSFIWDPIGYILKTVYSNKINKILFLPMLFIAEIIDTLIFSQSTNVFVGGAAHNAYIHSKVSIEKVHIVHPSVYLQEIGRKSNYCLLVTAWKPGKKVEFIATIAKKFPKLKFKLAGKWIDENYRRDFEQLLKNNRILNVDILGSVSEAELIILYQKALFLLQINDDKGFGLPALEAASCSTTFVIPKNQGVCELFSDKVDGFFVTELNEDEIIKKITLLINKPEKAIKMGISAYKKVEKHFTWAEHVKKMINYIVKDQR